MLRGRVRTGIWLAMAISNASLVVVACGLGTVYLVPRPVKMHGLHLKSAFIIEGLHIEIYDDYTH